jgi:hypothetical protein
MFLISMLKQKVSLIYEKEDELTSSGGVYPFYEITDDDAIHLTCLQ